MAEGERWEGMDERYDDFSSFEANRQKLIHFVVGDFYNITLLFFFFHFRMGHSLYISHF